MEGKNSLESKSRYCPENKLLKTSVWEKVHASYNNRKMESSQRSFRLPPPMPLEGRVIFREPSIDFSIQFTSGLYSLLSGAALHSPNHSTGVQCILLQRQNYHRESIQGQGLVEIWADLCYNETQTLDSPHGKAAELMWNANLRHLNCWLTAVEA